MVRSDSNAARKQDGISVLLIDLESPGVTVRPIRFMNGAQFHVQLFFDEVRVPVENRIAGEGEGWNVAMATAGFERGLMLRSPARFQAAAERLVVLFRANETKAAPAAREQVMQAWMDAQAYAYNTYAVASKIMAGGHIGAEASLNTVSYTHLTLPTILLV